MGPCLAGALRTSKKARGGKHAGLQGTLRRQRQCLWAGQKVSQSSVPVAALVEVLADGVARAGAGSAGEAGL